MESRTVLTPVLNELGFCFHEAASQTSSKILVGGRSDELAIEEVSWVVFGVEMLRVH